MTGRRVRVRWEHEAAPVALLTPPVATATLELLRVFAASWRGETCSACGCLCRPDEVCPGCLASRARAAS